MLSSERTEQEMKAIYHTAVNVKTPDSFLFSGVICQIAWRADGSCFRATSLLLSAVTGDHQMKNIND